MGLTASSGPGHRPQVGGARARGHGRAAARRRRRPAGRPIDRHADEERAGRPAPGPLRPQQRLADPGRRPGDARRVLRHGDRGVADRPEVRDPGRLPLRRVPRHRRRAVADPVDRGPAGHLGRELDGARRRSSRTSATPRRSPASGPSRARRASSTGSAASRRPTSPATSATTPTTTTGCSCSARRRSPGSPTTSRRSRSYGPGARRPADPRLGLDVRRDPERGRAAHRRGPAASPTPTCATSTRSRRTPRRSSGATARC